MENQIKECLLAGNVATAVDILEGVVKKGEGPRFLLNQAVLLISRFRQLENHQVLGRIPTSTYIIQENQIASAILHLLEEKIERVPTEDKQEGPWQQAADLVKDGELGQAMNLLYNSMDVTNPFYNSLLLLIGRWNSLEHQFSKGTLYQETYETVKTGIEKSLSEVFRKAGHPLKKPPRPVPADGYIRRMRAKIGHDKFIHPAARIIVENDKGWILMIKRRDNGRYGIPAGAFEEGESIEECIRREVLEETGLRLLSVEVIGISTQPARESVNYPNGDRIQYFTIEFHSSEWEGTLRPQDPAEVAYAEFMPPEMMTRLPKNEQSALESWRHFQKTGKVMLK